MGARSDGLYSTAEGNATIASGTASHAEGNSNSATGQYSHVEGTSNVAGGESSHAGGIRSNASRRAQFSRSSGSADLTKSFQFGQVYMMIQTSDINPHILVNGPAGLPFVLENHKSYAFRYTLIARSGTTGISKVWTGSGGAKMIAGVASDVGAPVAATVIAFDIGTAGWLCTVAVNVGTSSLDMTVQDPAGDTINWMAELSWVEVEHALGA